MSLAQRIRNNVARSRRTTSEILGATSELVQAHERILEQLDTFNQPTLSAKRKTWTIAVMKRELGGFKAAKNHFAKIYGIKAKSWTALVEKVNTIESALVHLGYWQ
ncbi:hypothetical protein [Chroococcidiopsis sp. TS-821]|uniref:hypothetical protein n=1 Tax=Chroococcidiopsis sp. TS-821 TaxID=1378066 RepID=UPI000CEE6700|nr:hypothetical protein [Chroococcidiopsis sp. TS-821]PPS40240.1 hypothetical protein B1A85_20850 [Chroococcidiopsis sp. TS-821]